MKYRRIFFLLFLFMICRNTLSQDWYQNGSTWYFNQQALLSFPAHGFERFTIVRDTVISELDCKVVERQRYSYNNILTFSDILIVREENQKVFLWNFEDEEFKKMYDFSLMEGDTLEMDLGGTCNLSSPILIDSITDFNIGNDVLRIQHFSFSYEKDNQLHYYSDSIIEKIGSTKSFTYKPRCGEDSWGNNWLRCYIDSTVFFKAKWYLEDFENAPCDTTIDGSTFILNDYLETFKIYPNPVNDKLYIKSEQEEILSISLINQTGRIVNKRDYYGTNIELDLTDYISGLYFIIIQTENKKAYFMIIKQ